MSKITQEEKSELRLNIILKMSNCDQTRQIKYDEIFINRTVLVGTIV